MGLCARGKQLQKRVYCFVFSLVLLFIFLLLLFRRVCCSTFYPPKSISISPSAEWMVVLFFRFFFSLSHSLGPFPPASPTLFSPATLVSSWHPPFPYNHFCSLAITFNSPLISLSPLLPGVTGRSHIHTKRTGDYCFIPQYSEMFSEPYPPSHWFSSLECSPFEKIAEGQERNKKKKTTTDPSNSHLFTCSFWYKRSPTHTTI